jgi:Ca-activated chloride channel family protein
LGKESLEKEYEMKKIRYTNMLTMAMATALSLAACAGISLADGFIIVPPPYPRPTPGWQAFPLEVKYHNVIVEIKGSSATTSIDQEFHNPTGRRLDGYYIFPVPEGAAIGGFSMFVDGKELAAEMLDSKKARRIYEDIVRKNIDPALLEYYQQGLFRVRIFPIEPYSNKRIKISYRQILENDYGTSEYVYPLNTEKFSSKPLEDVAIRVNISSQVPLKNIYCPTHEVDIVRKDAHTSIVTYEAHRVKPDKDFALFYRTDRSQIGLSMALQKEPDDSRGFFLLDISPDFDMKPEDIEEKDMTFVLDVSGSMAGDKLRQAKKALIFCINSLNTGDRFDLIRFSTEAEALFGKAVPATEENKRKAAKFVEDLRAIGGTNIEDALRLLAKRDHATHRPAAALFITDGKPTINETNEEKLVELVKKERGSPARIFTFGIGNDINTHLLDKITSATDAYRTYCAPEEDIEIKISNLYEKIQSPVLTDLKIRVDSDIQLTQVFPRELPDLFKGASIAVLGRYAGSGEKTLSVEGMLKGKMVRYECRCDFSSGETKNGFIPPIWAARKVGYLLDQIRLNGESKEVVDELVDLGKRYGIITPYTSYLIVEDETRRLAGRRIRQEDQTLGFIAPPASDAFESSKRSYSAMKEETGAGSVSASKQVQALRDARNMENDVVKGMSLGGPGGKASEPELQVRYVQGRALVWNGNCWIDPAIQKGKHTQTIRIKYGTDAFFGLLAQKPLTARFLSLGKNVRFVLDGILYEVSEE